MIDDQVKELSLRRMERAHTLLWAAENNYRLSDYHTALNRAYYAAFYALRAVLVLDGIEMKHHSGVLSEFRRMYIKTGVFPTEFSHHLALLFESRTESDYDDYFEADADECHMLIEHAAVIIDALEIHISERLNSR